MRAGIVIISLIGGLAMSLPVSAAEDNGPPGGRAAPADTAKDAQKKEPAPPPSVTVIGARDALGILGREVRSAANENMGRIVDVIVDREGAVRAAVIDFGGFLGVGSRKIVVDWSALHFGRVANKSDSITLELTKEQVTAAPEYKQDAPVIVLGAAGRLQPWDFDK
ncbi:MULTISPECIES: PRC-barrel domain-containing protein [unclassified Bradyrhizobium]|uniref:PRC-barrel domain-containing protein n=1 Tax=unclassified Bradyrhizobium TaxID=2631580 RepID=UPI002FF2AB4D